MRTALLVLVSALAGTVEIGAARAATESERCAAAVASAAPEFFARAAAALASCRRLAARGGELDCLGRATVQPLQNAARALDRLIHRKCSDAAVSSLRFGGDCFGVRTADDLAACLTGSHYGDAVSLIEVTAPARGRLAPAVRRCQAVATSRARAFALVRLHALQDCKQQPPAGLLPGTECASDPGVDARLSKRVVTAQARIAARCGDAVVAAAALGAECAHAAVPAECVLGVAAAVGDDALAAESRDTGFCGDAHAAVEQRIDALLAQMTLEEKIAQMHGTAFPTPGLSGRTAANERLGIPGITMIDGPRGVSAAARPTTAFPVGSARGATWDPALEERVGEAMGVEARARGAAMILAPTINILRHPRWGRAQETYGEDNAHLARMGVAFVRGAQRRVIANPKHYAANSIENTRFSVDVTVDERTLREIYLRHFEATVRQGRAGSLMSAYNKVNGAYCGENPHLLNEVLKGDWGFQGFVESDWIVGTRSTVPAVTAGLDIEMPIARFFGTELADAVAAGRVGEPVIDEAVRRILRAQLCFRLDTDPPVPDAAQVETPATKALSLEVAQKGIVLLKNVGGALPIDRGSVGSVVVVGDLATFANLGDFGSSTVVPSSAVTPLDGIRAAAGTVPVTHVAGPTFSASDEAAISTAGAAIVVVGLTYEDEGEGLITIGDRLMLGLPRNQDALVTQVAALNPRTVVVLEGSGAITMPWLDQVGAVVMAWYPGDQGGTAIADVLFGSVNPSGKLPVSFPRAESDLPPFDDVSHAVTYDFFHGYRHLDHNGVAPLFPFGFGLSYATFQYANLTVAPATISPWGRVRVTADVTNTGVVAGEEVAQLYVGYDGSRVARAPRDLKAFARVHLEPGETKTVPFEVRAADVAFWDSAGGAFVVEPIAYDVTVGSSSRDLPLAGSFAVAP
jgi:beta-glucosidase